jgi:hypothetical protein
MIWLAVSPVFQSSRNCLRSNALQETHGDWVRGTISSRNRHFLRRRRLRVNRRTSALIREPVSDDCVPKQIRPATKRTQCAHAHMHPCFKDRAGHRKMFDNPNPPAQTRRSCLIHHQHHRTALQIRNLTSGGSRRPC